MRKLALLFPLIFTMVISLGACNGDNVTGKNQGNDSEKLAAESTSSTKRAEKKKKKFAIELTRAEFLEKVLDYTQGPDKMGYLGDKPAIVDFWAPWCGPCRMASPILEELAEEYHGKIVVYKVNTQNEQQIAAELGIQSIPTFIFFPMSGKPFATSGIARTPEETKKMFKEIIDKQLLGKK